MLVVFKLGSCKGLNALYHVMNEENTILWYPSESKYIYNRSVATFGRTAQEPTSPLNEIYYLFSVFVAGNCCFCSSSVALHSLSWQRKVRVENF